MVDAEDEVLAANAAFYDVFSAHDLSQMDDVWAREAEVACIHPGWGLLSDRASIMRSWRSILDNGPFIWCSNERVRVCGEIATVVCHEHIEGLLLIATNVFMREGPRWAMVHHHAAPVALEAMEEELADSSAEPPKLRLLN